PALGFGMGDVVLGELLRDRGLNVTVASPDFWVSSADEADDANVVRAATVLRRSGASVEYALRKQQIGKQRKAAISAGAAYFVTLDAGFATSGAVRVEELSERGSDTDESALMRALADKPATFESLRSGIQENP